MTIEDGDDKGLAALQRMIAYVRDEAVRLRIMDVAVLLEHAEDAVASFAPRGLARPRRAGFQRDRTLLEH